MGQPLCVDPNATSVYPALLLADQNIVMFRGDTVVLTRQWLQDGAALNITGALGLRLTAKFQVSDTDANAAFIKTVGAGVTVTTAATGLFTVTISPVDTRSLTGGSTAPDSRVDLALEYDIQLTSSTGAVYTGARGQLIVRPDVSITTS